MTALFKYRHSIGGISYAENSSRRFNSGRTARFVLQTNEVHADSSSNCSPASQARAAGASAPPSTAAQTPKHLGRPRPTMVFDIKQYQETKPALRPVYAKMVPFPDIAFVFSESFPRLGVRFSS
jgi:hypothetical protein